MASRVAINAMDNMIVKTAKVYEGILTRVSDSVSPMGGVNEGAAYYAAPVVKGDLVKIYAHTETAGHIIVEKAAAAAEDNNQAGNMCHGVAVSSPFGADNVTSSGNAPAAANRREVSVLFFGLGIVEFNVDASSAIAPGDLIGMDENENNAMKTITAYASLSSGNGGIIALTYAAAGGKVAALVGASFYHDAD